MSAVDPLSWVRVQPPYFITEEGKPFTPIGQNDAITWPELHGLFRRRDTRPAEKYFSTLASHGVTVLRLMLEYSQFQSRYFERPAGKFQPNMVRLWDDIFALCREHGLRVLLTPFDSFWMWIRWDHHPYNRKNGGPCAARETILLCPETRKFIKDRLAFASERWGADGAIFAWDLWNEIHPSYARDSADCFADFITDLSEHLRAFETRRYGRAHPQTVSMFGPHLVLDSRIPDSIFRHPSLDFASTHFYEEGTIDYPLNTVDPAIATGRLMREALFETEPERPFFDSEHGPIHMFKDHHRTLPDAFDEEYFRHMQWAHFAGGGAGGGMRWPNRHPHSLTHGMRQAQCRLARFLPLIDFTRFKRRNLNEEIRVSNPAVKVVACGDDSQAIVWLVRNDTIGANGMLRREAEAATASIEVPGLAPGRYSVTAWDPSAGRETSRFDVDLPGPIEVPPFVADTALAIC
jgi:mannan endo-1,4-beta-mannosidase